MMPSLFVMMRDWLASGEEGLPPMPSFTGSNSHNATAAAGAVSSAADALASQAADALASQAGDALVSPAAAPLVTSAADAFVTPTAARALERRTPDTSGASAPSVTCPPAVGGPSTLAELDTIMVTKPRPMTSSNFL